MNALALEAVDLNAVVTKAVAKRPTDGIAVVVAVARVVRVDPVVAVAIVDPVAVLAVVRVDPVVAVRVAIVDPVVAVAIA